MIAPTGLERDDGAGADRAPRPHAVTVRGSVGHRVSMRLAILSLLLVCGCAERGFAIAQTVPSTPTDTDGDPLVDQFVISGTDQVDILFVVDDTQAMAEYQDELADLGAAVLDYLATTVLDAHLGVVTADPEDFGRLRVEGAYRYVDSDTNHSEEVLSALLDVGTEGTHPFAALDVAYAAIETQGGEFNTGFLREGSALHFLVLAGADDASEQLSAAEFGLWLSGLGDSNELVGFSAVAPDSSEPWSDLVDLSDGVLLPIDEAEWSHVLSTQDLTGPAPLRTFPLAVRPDPRTLAVQAQEDTMTYRFTTEELIYIPVSNSVEFVDFVPGLGVTITVSYQPRSDE